MTKYELLSKTDHENLRFTPASNFEFAKGESVVSIGVSEVPYLAKDVPIVFVKNKNNTFSLNVMFGLIPGENKLINDAGKLLLPYAPAILRCYPFKLIKLKSKSDDTKNHSVLGFYNDTAYFSTNPSENNFAVFDNDKNINEHLASINKLLSALTTEFERASAMIEEIAELDILTEIDIAEKSGQKKRLKNIFTVNEEKFHGINGKDLKKLNKNNSLDLIFYQKHSLLNFRNLLKNNDALGISSRDSVIRANKEKKDTEINDLVQDLLIGNED